MQFFEIPEGDEQVFQDPKPEIVLVIKDGCIINAYSLNGDATFAYTVIDLDNRDTDGENPIPPTPDTYVVDGTADSVEEVLSLSND